MGWAGGKTDKSTSSAGGLSRGRAEKLKGCDRAPYHPPGITLHTQNYGQDSKLPTDFREWTERLPLHVVLCFDLRCHRLSYPSRPTLCSRKVQNRKVGQEGLYLLETGLDR